MAMGTLKKSQERETVRRETVRRNSVRGNDDITERVEYRTEGTAVRKVYTVPEREPQKKQSPTAVPHRRQAAGATMSWAYSVFLTAICVFTFFMGVKYLQQYAESVQYQREIAKQEEILSDLIEENNDNLNYIESSIDLDDIRDRAINELDMVYANSENVVYYENTQQDYVSQYTEVPKAE